MTKSRFDRRFLSLTLVLATIAFLQNTPQSLNPTAGARSLPAVADLTAERQALSSFASNLSNLELKVATLLKGSSITSSDLNSAKSTASALKTNVAQVQQTFQSVINKLKASGEWNKFDQTALSLATDSETQSILTSGGGAKRILENAASQLSGLSAEIDSLVQPLNSRVASSGVSPVFRGAAGFMPAGASFTAPAPVGAPAPFFESLKCRFRSAVWLVKDDKGSLNRMVCACNKNPPPSYSCGSATS